MSPVQMPGTGVRVPGGGERYHHGDLPTALLRVALDILAEHGVPGLTLRQVARRAGVSPMAPYRHFPSKEALLAAVAEQGFRKLEQRLTETPRADPRTDLIAQGVAYVRFACEEPALYRLMFGPFLRRFDDYPGLKDAAMSAKAALTRAVAAATPNADEPARQDAALACWSLSHGLASLLVDGRLSGAAAAENAAEWMTRVLSVGVSNITE
jgi:AcrR family transcriptional regulator